MSEMRGGVPSAFAAFIADVAIFLPKQNRENRVGFRCSYSRCRDRAKFIECMERNFLIWSELREPRVLAVHAKVTQLLTES